MESNEFLSAVCFSNSIENKNILLFQNLFKTLAKFKLIYDQEKSNLPYHINLIDELHADENAHSRILAKLLRYKENNTFPYLEKFLTVLCNFDLNVVKPIVKKVDSCGRIDIPIFDQSYVVVIENKVTDKAIDQNTDKGGQLARYIETIKNNYNKSLDSIFVVYTPRFAREPAEDCWINNEGYSYKDEFKSRYCSVSYRDCIYPWLKNEILPSISDNDKYLQSAVQQYIDYLEGIFSLRIINKKMNMKLQEFIKRELGIENEQPEEAIKMLLEKKAELENAIIQLDLLRTEYSKEVMIAQFGEWKSMLEKDFSTMEIVGNNFEQNDSVINVGIKFSIDNNSFVAMIEVNEVNRPNIYIGLGRHFASKDKHDTLGKLTDVIESQELDKVDNWWYGWKYTSVNNAYMRLKNIINAIEDIQ